MGGLALGATLPYYYGYPYDPYLYDPYQVDGPPTYVEQQPISDQPPLIQREVVYSHGKYVLYGDGMRQPWQWVWVPAAPPSPPPPSQR